MQYKDLKEMQKGLELWKPRLGLTDHLIRVKWMPQKELGVGETSHDPRYDQAVIWIKKNPGQAGELGDLGDHEATLIHELVHVAIGMPTPEDPVENERFEKGVERLARALRKAYRS